MCYLTTATLLVQLSLGYDAEFLRAVKAMGVVESNNDPQAYRVSEQALGHLQIRPDYLRDVNAFLRARGAPAYSRQDCKNPNKAMHMVYVYTSTYAKRYGYSWTAETIARLHNGGPKGCEKKATLSYARKVRAAMKKISDRGLTKSTEVGNR
jgi:hypothetical protein